MTRTIAILALALLAIWIPSMYLHWLAGFLVLAIAMFILQPPPSLAAFLGGISAGLIWISLAWVLSESNNHLLADQVGDLFGGLSGLSMVLLTGILGAVGGALAGWLGAHMRDLLIKDEKNSSTFVNN